MSTPTPQLADLLTVPSQDDVLNQEVIPELQKRSVKVTNWIVGGVYRAMAFVVALMRVNVRLAIAAMVAAGFEDYAFGFATPPPNPDGSIIDVTAWAPIIAQQRYGVVQLAATYTRRTITLTNTANVSYGPLQPGPTLMVKFPSGNRYLLDQVVTIPSSGGGGVVTATFRSEFPSNSAIGLVYNDPPDSVLQLVTSNFPGVTASNPHPTYSPVAQSGNSIGTVTPSGAPASSPHAVAIRIDATGSLADASVRWSTNVDNTGWVSQGSASTASNLGGVTGLNVTLADNGGAPAFVYGSVFYYQTPGTDVTQIGADVETPQALGTRCRGLWPSLAFAKDSNGNWIPVSPSVSAYVALALSANAQVRIAFVATDGTINNKLNIVIAGQGGAPVSPAVVANEQSFFNSFSMLTDLPVVQTSTARPLMLGGLTIYTKPGQTDSAKAALTLRLQTYLGGVDVATPFSINGTVDYDYIIALARTTPGVTKVSGTLTLTTSAGTVTQDLPLPITPGAFESATWSQSAATAFNWAVQP